MTAPDYFPLQTISKTVTTHADARGHLSLMDRAAVALLIIVVAVAVLYPESFISGFPLFGAERSQPLSLLMPVMVLMTVAYALAASEGIRPRLLDVTVLAFSAWLLLRNLPTDERLTATKYALLGFSLFYLTAMSSRRVDLKRVIMWLFVGLALLTSIYAFIEYALQENFIFQQYISETVKQPLFGIHRAGSTLAHPVSFGGFLVQVLPFCLLALVAGRTTWQKLIGIAATGFGLTALLLTYSKGSWIVALLIAAAAVIYFSSSRDSRRINIYLVGFIVVLLAIFAVVFHQQVADEFNFRSQESVSDRLASWRAALDGIRENPVFGVGLKQGNAFVLSRLDESARRWVEQTTNDQPVDNYFLNIFLENGVIGLLLWLAILVLIAIEGVRLAGRSPPLRPWALAALAGLAGISLNSVTFDTMLLWPNFVLFWVTAGLLHGLAIDAGVSRPLGSGGLRQGSAGSAANASVKTGDLTT